MHTRLMAGLTILLSISICLAVEMERTTALDKDSPVGHWSFEGTQTGENADGNTLRNAMDNTPGTIHGGTWTKGIKGNGLEFDGIHTYVQLPVIDPERSRTLALWFKVNPDSTDSNHRYMISHYYPGAPDNRRGYAITWGWGAVRGFIADGNKRLQEVVYRTTKGKWHHVALVHNYERNMLYLYVDGEKQDIKTIAGYSPSYNYHPLYLGKCQSGKEQINFFHGILDDVRIYNRALSAQEVKKLYQSEPSALSGN